METVAERLERLAVPDLTWMAKAEERERNKDWLRISFQIALTVLFALDEKKITKRELAEKLGCSPQYVTKIVKGSENLTLETICKLEKALDIKLIHSAFSIEHPDVAVIYEQDKD